MNTVRALFKARLLRGAFDGSRLWLLVGLALGTRKLGRRLKGKGPEVLYCEKLKRGQSLLITHVSQPRGGGGTSAEPR